MMRVVPSYLAALLTGLIVLWIATPLPAILGLTLSLVSLAYLVCFGMLASVLPYLAAYLILSRGGFRGQNAQMALGALVAALSTLLLNLWFSGVLTSYLYSVRTGLGVLLAGVVAGFVHHAAMSAERKTI